MMGIFPQLHAMLHLDPYAIQADVHNAYRLLLRRHHPDICPTSATQDEAAAEHAVLRQTMDAHAVLADPVRRARCGHNFPDSHLGRRRHTEG